MHEIDNILYEFRKQGIDFTVVNDELKVKGSSDKINDSLISRVKSIKSELIFHLQSKNKQYYPISVLQQRLCKAYFSAPDGYVHNLYSIITLVEDIELDRLKSAFSQLILDYEILRTGYESNQNEFMQVIYPNVDITFTTCDIKENEIFNWINRESNQKLSIDRGQVIKCAIANIQENNEIICLIIVHHISCDFDSLQMIIDILEQYYYKLDNKKKLPQQFKQYVIEEISKYGSSKFNSSLQYWQSQVVAVEPVFSHANTLLGNENYIRKTNLMVDELGIDVSAKLFNLIKSYAVSPHNFLLALFQLLIEKISTKKKFQVGIPISLRTYEQQYVLGIFVDTYWVQASLDDSANFLDLVNSVKNKMLNILPHTHCGFYDVLKTMDLEFNVNGPFPIFQVSFNWVKSRISTKNLLVKKYHGSKNTGFDSAPYDLMLVASDEGGHIKLLWVYAEHLFSSSNLKQFSNEFRSIINQLCENL